MYYMYTILCVCVSAVYLKKALIDIKARPTLPLWDETHVLLFGDVECAVENLVFVGYFKYI